MCSSSTIPLLELFSSIQGEGAHVGEPQVFVRLAGCPLRCRWCDTRESWPFPTSGATARVLEGERDRRVPAPVSAPELARLVERLDPVGGRPVSVTGGEPLMWPDALLALRAALPARRLHLETSGAFPRSLAAVREAFDHLSVDLKLPEELGAPVDPGPRFEPAPRSEGSWREARRAVLLLLAGRDACAKLVVTAEPSPERYASLLADLSELSPATPLYLQPVTPLGGSSAPSAGRLERLVDDAQRFGLTVRVVPQLHPVLGVR